MQTLFLDFGSHEKTIALVHDGKTTSIRTLHERPLEATLLPLIKTVVEEGGGTLESLQRIATISGPGGFMSLRTGISIANALAWSLRIPVGGVLLPDLWRARLQKPTDILWLHSTKKDLLFVKSLGEKTATFSDISTVAPETLPKMITYVGELIPEHATALQATLAPDLYDVKDVLPTVLESISYADAPLLPWYGRGI